MYKLCTGMKLNWLKCIKNCIGSKFIQINIKVDYQTRLHPRPVACPDMTLPLMNGSGDNHCLMDHFDVNHCLMDHFDDNHCLMDHFDDSITSHNGPLWWFHCFYFHCSPLRSSLVRFGPLWSTWFPGISSPLLLKSKCFENVLNEPINVR